MIVPMKKIAVLVQSKEAQAALQGLRKLGVVHVEHQRLPAGDDIVALGDDIACVNQALGTLSSEDFIQPAPPEKAEELGDWKVTARHIIDLGKRFNQLKEYALTLREHISQWLTWGDFEPANIKELERKSVYIRFYQIPARQIRMLAPEVIIKEISSVRGVVNCLVLARQKIELPFKAVALPKMGLGQMQKRLAQDQETMESIRQEISRQRCYRQALLRIKGGLQQELEFAQALRGMGEAGTLAYLRGYVPRDAVQLLQQAARSQGWGLVISDPAAADRVPTLIRNPRWVAIIQPVFKLIEVVPGYRELDISLWFLLFFSVFFGMLIGDAGYGAIFFTLTFLARRKWGRKVANEPLFVLLYILSSCAIIWGVLSGTFFGQAWLPQTVKPVIAALRSSQSVQRFCFFLGAIHLSVAHLWRAVLRWPARTALAEVGWIVILWGAFLLARMLVLGEVFPAFGKWLLISGPILVVLFSSAHKNLLKGVACGLGKLLLNAVNSFTDIVSYIRLFIVGLATVAVADAFNKMAMDVGFGTVGSGLITALILLLGHCLNILLGPMSILVHGVRLNVLEFCNHLGIEWRGLSYRPLKEEA